MDAEKRVVGWTSTTTATTTTTRQCIKMSASIDLAFRDLSYIVGKGKPKLPLCSTFTPSGYQRLLSPAFPVNKTVLVGVVRSSLFLNISGFHPSPC